MQASVDTAVSKPIETVWDFITNVENYDKWSSDVSEPRQTSEGPYGAGTTFSLKSAYRGKTYDIKGTVTAFDPQSHLAMRMADGPFPFQEFFDLESAGEGTKMKHTIEVRPDNPLLRIVFSVFGPLMVRGQMKKEARVLKQHLESE